MKVAIQLTVDAQAVCFQVSVEDPPYTIFEPLSLCLPFLLEGPVWNKHQLVTVRARPVLFFLLLHSLLLSLPPSPNDSDPVLFNAGEDKPLSGQLGCS